MKIDPQDIRNVIDNDYCIGCGNCAIYTDKISLNLNEYGLYEPLIMQDLNEQENAVLSNICPFSGGSENEDSMGERLYGNLDNRSKHIGFYRNVYIGWVCDESERMSSSSGGLTSYLLDQLLNRSLVDGVVHVHSAPKDVSGYVQYVLSTTSAELEKGKKSRYHIVTYKELYEKIVGFNGVLAFVGVPCVIKSMRLLQQYDEKLEKKIAFYFALFCGHQKSVAYTEYLAAKVSSTDRVKDLISIDYRVKNEVSSANNYIIEARYSDGDICSKQNNEIPWTDWGLGLFKPKACDVCDDVSGEVADIILGDAWIKPYVSDYRGTNIIVVRNKVLEEILKDRSDAGEIILKKSSEKDVLSAQGGNFRHRKEGVLSRVYDFKEKGCWYPDRRESLYRDFKLNEKRHELYLMRAKLSEMSHRAFRSAKTNGDIEEFFEKLRPLVESYYKCNKSFMKTIKSLAVRLLKRHSS